MARARSSGNGLLEESMTALSQSMTALNQSVATLNQAHAEMNQTQTALLARLSETERINAERFARIEATLAEHSRTLAEHGRILAEMWRFMQAMPEAIREKIGFKPPL